MMQRSRVLGDLFRGRSVADTHHGAGILPSLAFAPLVTMGCPFAFFAGTLDGTLELRGKDVDVYPGVKSCLGGTHASNGDRLCLRLAEDYRGHHTTSSSTLLGWKMVSLYISNNGANCTASPIEIYCVRA